MKFLSRLTLMLAIALPLHAQTHTVPALDTNHNFTGHETHTGTETFVGPVRIQGPEPWIDVRTYGARPLPVTDGGKMTTGTTSTGNSSVRVASAGDFQNGDGIVISKAGAATTQNTPSAPIVTPLGVTGSSTISYKCVGADALEGLTGASPAGSTMTAPAVFGNQAVAISSISRSSNEVTVNFSSAINASANQHLIIMNVEGSTLSFNGIFLIVSAPTRSQITFAQTGPNESGTVSATAAGRLVNGFVITSISRTGYTMTVTTDVNHNFVVGTTLNPTLVEIYGVGPTDMDGWYSITSVPAANQFTVTTGYAVVGTETGSAYVGSTTNGFPNWNTMGVYSWEANQVSCPAVSGTTSFYYVYANYGGGTYSLVGATLPGLNVFKDWGPFLGSGYTPPPAAQVPATAPSVAQDQEFVGTITSISGTTFTLNQAVPTAVSSQPAFHDNSIAIQNADNAACKGDGSVVYFSGPAAMNAITNAYQYYVWNAPFWATTIPNPSNCYNVQWYLGVAIAANDTMADNIRQLTLKNFGAGFQSPSAAEGNYAIVGGFGNPMIYGGYEYAPLFTDGIEFADETNGQTGVYIGSQYSRFENSYLSAGDFSTSVSLELAGSFNSYLRNIVFTGFPGFKDTYGTADGIPDGQPVYGPPIPTILVQDTNSITVTGYNSAAGKGIEFFTTGTGTTMASKIENILTDQAPWTPIVWFWGDQNRKSVELLNAVQDSHSVPALVNLGCYHCANVTLDMILTVQIPAVTGYPLTSLTVRNEYPDVFIGQNLSTVRESASTVTNYQTETQQGRPFVFPLAWNYPLFWEQATVGVTTSASGRGTFPLGVHRVCVLPVGWNGGDGGIENGSCAYVTVNGSQGIQVSWTATSGVQGYDVYIDSERENARPLASTTAAYSAGGTYASQPTLPGSGLPLIDQNQVATSRLRLTNGVFKMDVTAPTLSENVSGSIPLAPTSLTTTSATSDSVTVAGITSSGHCYLQPTNASAATNLSTTYVSAKTTNQIAVTHTGTSGMTFDIICTAN